MSADTQTHPAIATYAALHRVVSDHVSDDEVRDVRSDRDRRLFSFNRRDHAARFWCAHHGWVQPYGNRYDCPYCMPVLPDDPPARVVRLDRATGMVVLNPS